MGEQRDFEHVDAFTVGAVGRPGARTFFVQARQGTDEVTVKCEKQQAAAIAEYLRRVLSDLPVDLQRPPSGALALEMPFDTAFVLGPVGLGYDRDNDRVLVQLEEFLPVDDEGEPLDPDEADDRSRLRVFLTRGQAAAFCTQADELVSAGRPTCTWCSLPIDPDGHACPRMN